MLSIFSSTKNCPQVKACLMPIRLSFVFILLVLLANMYKRGKDLNGVYKRISQEDCSDEFTNASFKDFDIQIGKHCVNRALASLIIVLIIFVGSCIVESIFHCFWLISCRCLRVYRATIDENKQENDRKNELVRIKHSNTMGMVPAPSLESRKEMAR
jgi:hypothetical protein